MDSGSSVAVCTKSPQAANQACPLSTCATFCWWPSRVQTQTHTKTQTSASTNTWIGSQKFRITHYKKKAVKLFHVLKFVIRLTKAPCLVASMMYQELVNFEDKGEVLGGED